MIRNILNNRSLDNQKIRGKNVNIVLSVNFNICFGYSKEQSQWEGYLSTHNICFGWEIRKIMQRNPFEYKKRITLDQEDSNRSLWEIYEQEYLKQQMVLSVLNFSRKITTLKKKKCLAS